MLSKGPAKKVTIFVNEDTQHHLGAARFHPDLPDAQRRFRRDRHSG